VPASVLLPALRQTQEGGYLAGDVEGWQTTQAARDEWDRFSAALKAWLLERLEAPGTDAVGELSTLEEALHRMVGRLLDEEASAARGPEDLVLIA
jgi:hypothetical protein